jgi:hypothetical protein
MLAHREIDTVLITSTVTNVVVDANAARRDNGSASRSVQGRTRLVSYAQMAIWTRLRAPILFMRLAR